MPLPQRPGPGKWAGVAERLETGYDGKCLAISILKKNVFIQYKYTHIPIYAQV